MAHKDDANKIRCIINGVEKVYNTARSIRAPTEEEISATINRMPTKYQPAARRAAVATSKVTRRASEWVRKRYESYTTQLLAPPEPTHTWGGNTKRAASPDMDSISSCDGEGEIFPVKRHVSPDSARRVEKDLEDAMKEGLAIPRPLAGVADGMEPGRGRVGNRNARGRGRQQEKRDSDVVVAQNMGNGRVWKREMTAEEKRRREEIEKEWKEKEERCWYEEENDAMDDVGENMFKPTMGAEMHSQKSDAEGLSMERSRHFEKSSSATELTERPSRGRPLERGPSRVERSTRIRKERTIPMDGEGSTQTSRSNGLDPQELSSRKNESRQHSRSENGFVGQPLRGRAMDGHLHLSARSGNSRPQLKPENIDDLAAAAAEVFRENNVPKKVEQPQQQENKPLEKQQPEKKQSENMQVENKRPVNTLGKGKEQAEDSSSDDALQRPRRIRSGPLFRKQEDEEDMPFAMPPISKSTEK